MADQDTFDEKHKISEQVIDSPPSEPDHGIVKDWDVEESAVRRKYVQSSSRINYKQVTNKLRSESTSSSFPFLLSPSSPCKWIAGILAPF